MTTAHKLGASFRRLGSLLNVRAVRTDDTVRRSHRPDDAAFTRRADEIEAQALAVEQSLND